MAREEQKMRSDGVRQAILDTALRMGLEEGFEEVSVRKIIKKMKYSTGVIYYHFKDKQEIIDAIIENETKWLHSQIRELLDESKDAVSNMVCVFNRVMRLAFEEPEKYNLIVLHKYSRQSPERPQWISYLSENFKRDVQNGIMKEMDTEKVAFSIWSSFLGFNLMISRQQDLNLQQAEELFQVQCEIILKGVLKHE